MDRSGSVVVAEIIIDGEHGAFEQPRIGRINLNSQLVYMVGTKKIRSW